MESTSVLIADCGATKCDWALVRPGQETVYSSSAGFNPNVFPEAGIKQLLAGTAAANGWVESSPAEIRFYGAGCGTVRGQAVVNSILGELFPQAEIKVSNDVLGAALALYNDRPLVACILGTGSASVYFDGTQPQPLRASLGWTIGDEGGGCAIGKRVLRNVFYELWPEEVLSAFREQYPDMTVEKYLKTVRSEEAPNRFLATFAPFAARFLHVEEVRREVYDELCLFVQWQVAPFCRKYDCEAAFCGSVAHYFRVMLEQICEEEKITCGKILVKPLEELVKKQKSA